MNLTEILKTESKNVEFKLELPQKDVAFLKTAVAFANCQGGHFVFGVRNEDHAVVGMNDETLFQDMDTITNIISDNCEPTIMPNVYPVTVQGKSLIIVEISAGRQRPYYVKSLGMMKGTFYRVSAETRKAEEYMVKELMFEWAHRFFDKTVCLGLDASEEEIAALCQSLYDKAMSYQATQGGNTLIRKVTPNQLLSWGILTKHEDKIAPTNAYALLTGHYLLPSMIQCAMFKGTTKNVFLDKREYEGSIQDQQEEAYQFVLRNIKLGARITGLYRQDVYEIPPSAIREILVNAVVHRSYLATGNIQVALYEDRLEVVSPGKLPIDQSIEAMKNGFSKIRNEALAKAFAYMGLIEGWGSGIPKINALLREAGLKELEISGGDFFLKFTIYRDPNFNPMADDVTNVGDRVGDDQENDAPVLQFLKDNPQASAKDLAIHFHITTLTAERILKQLKKSGKLEYVASSGQWSVVSGQKNPMLDPTVDPTQAAEASSNNNHDSPSSGDNSPSSGDNSPSSGKDSPSSSDNSPSNRDHSPSSDMINKTLGKLLRVFDGEMSPALLRDLVGISDRTYFRIHYLNVAIDKGYIEATQPESPNSPTQKYRLTAKGQAFLKELTTVH